MLLEEIITAFEDIPKMNINAAKLNDIISVTYIHSS